jgi:hypothetical protein
MIIERTKNEVIFRLSSKVNVDDLQDIADLLEFKEISLKSKATQNQVDKLVNTIKKGRWAKTKEKLGL